MANTKAYSALSWRVLSRYKCLALSIDKMKHAHHFGAYHANEDSTDQFTMRRFLDPIAVTYFAE